MDIRISNLLELNLTNEDVNHFIDVFVTLKNSIQSQGKKVGFKKRGEVTVTLTEESIEFIMTLCENAGILSDVEIKEQEELKG
tara:strand:+ start:69 stop:317 length:249 start_codon:yes stop_codon:yes gene_type:complete